MKRILPLLLLLPFVLALPARGDEPAHWWNREYGFRKRIRLSEHQTWPDSPAAHVRLSTGGQAKEDGSDIRVVTAGGEEVPRAILARGPGDLFEVAFPVGTAREWYVYYGNPRAKAPRKPYVPDRGLVLETRKRAPGNPTNWPAMKKIFEASTQVFGGSIWPRVFDAENPFGPQDNFVSEYKGFIRAPRPGVYTFYTASDEASFLFVDGHLVTSWPGWHRAGRGAWAVFKGTIRLAPGLHRFRYVHVERTGPQVMAAYWLPPGQKKASVIPASAFPGFRDAEIVEHDTLGKRVAADFTALVAEKWGRDNRVYSAMLMKAQLGPPGTTYAFDFGDGMTGRGPVITHVYLTGGDYDVTLVVGSGKETDRETRRIHVPEEWTRYDRNTNAHLARFARIIATYPGRRLSKEEIRNAVYLLGEANREDAVLPILKDAVERGTDLETRERFRLALELGAICRDHRFDLEGSTWAFTRAASLAKPGLRRIEARVDLAEAELLLGGNAGDAKKILETAVKDLAGRRGDVARRAWLRLGDARMIAGDGDGAKAAYEKAQDLAGGSASSLRILKKAAEARAAMTFLETKDLRRATEELAKWEWDAPLDRFTGLHRLARARGFELAKRPDLAIRELSALLKGNPRSEYAPKALSMLAGIARAAGDEAAAQAYEARLKRDYPWSPLAK